MERSDTHEELTSVQPEPVIPKREEVEGDTPQDRMMRMVLSLRAELYDLYAKHQALLDENGRLKAKQVLTIKLKESEAKPSEETAVEGKADAVSSTTACEDGAVVGGVVADREEALVLPTTESESRTADAGVVSGDEKRPLTPCPQTPKFPQFRPEQGDLLPVSPSEHGLQEPPPLAPALVGSSSICCMSPPPNVESEQP